METFKTYGVTGGAGTGKSEVMRLLREDFGGFTILSDDVARDLMHQGGTSYQLIVDHFGSPDWYPTLFDKDGYFPFYADNNGCMDTTLELSAWESISKKAADKPMSNYLLVNDEFESGLVAVLEGQTTVDEYLTSITDAQNAAQAALDAEKEDK